MKILWLQLLMASNYQKHRFTEKMTVQKNHFIYYNNNIIRMYTHRLQACEQPSESQRLFRTFVRKIGREHFAALDHNSYVRNTENDSFKITIKIVFKEELV